MLIIFSDVIDQAELYKFFILATDPHRLTRTFVRATRLRQGYAAAGPSSPRLRRGRPVFAKATPRQAPLGQIQPSAEGGKTYQFFVAKLLISRLSVIASRLKHNIYCPKGMQFFPGQGLPRRSLGEDGSAGKKNLSVSVCVGPWLIKISCVSVANYKNEYRRYHIQD